MSDDQKQDQKQEQEKQETIVPAWTMRRTDRRPDGVFSEWLHNGAHVMMSCEHSYPVGDGFDAKITPGTYECVRGLHVIGHQHQHQIETFEITGVEGHSGLLVHPGNFEFDSEGCVLSGDYIRTGTNPETNELAWEVTGSQDAFKRFMAANEGVDSFWLVVE